jgi:cold shock protein
MRLEGTCKFFNTERGYGFIQTASGEDFFVHVSAISGLGYEALAKGQRVSFVVTPSRDGRTKASEVELLNPIISERRVVLRNGPTISDIWGK